MKNFEGINRHKIKPEGDESDPPLSGPVKRGENFLKTIKRKIGERQTLEEAQALIDEERMDTSRPGFERRLTEKISAEIRGVEAPARKKDTQTALARQYALEREKAGRDDSAQNLITELDRGVPVTKEQMIQCLDAGAAGTLSEFNILRGKVWRRLEAICDNQGGTAKALDLTKELISHFESTSDSKEKVMIIKELKKSEACLERTLQEQK